MKGQEYLKNVVTLELDREKCVGCGMCVTVCPQRVFALSDKKATAVNHDLCMECGACARNCPAEAISVRAGVGCAYGIIMGILNKSGPDNGCGCICSDVKL